MVKMINSIGFTNYSTSGVTAPRASAPTAAVKFTGNILPFKHNKEAAQTTPLASINTALRTNEEQKMYTELMSAVNASKSGDLSVLPQKYTQAQKLEVLLKNGKLLDNRSNDGSTTLENLYKTLNAPRLNGLSNVKIINQTIDAIFDPAIITQKFGDIPTEVSDLILLNPQTPEEIKENPNSINVANSGTCVATSIEFHMANKHPAEFARWVQNLSSPQLSVEQTIDISSLSKNFLDAIWLLDTFKLKSTQFNFERAKLDLKPDEQVASRVMLQNDYQDPGERSMIDVLMQSTIMNVGSQGTYNSLIDERKGDFSESPQGLIEFEKTFVESIIENNEKISIVYQKVDENQVITGYKCDFGRIEGHIRKAIKSGEDVIVGYVLTEKDVKEYRKTNPGFMPDCQLTGEDNKIVNGHEITIVDVKKGSDGETVFVCNDTDDEKDNFIEYSASYLLPKIHHAGYPASLVDQEHDLIYDWVEPQAAA